MYGLNGEHDIKYSIYVDESFYDQAKTIISDLI